MEQKQINVIEAGNVYEIPEVEGEGAQRLTFIKKEKNEAVEELVTVWDGVTNEGVLEVLIHRLNWLNELMPSSYNEEALRNLIGAREALRARTENRVARGVEGTSNQ